MLLTKPQVSRFWREWAAIKRQLKASGSTDAQVENERYALLQRAGFDSLTQVDTRAGFDRVLAECGALRDDVARTAEIDDHAIGQRRRLIYLIRKHASALGGEPYVLALARDKFGLTFGLRAIEDLTTLQLKHLMITLHARSRSRAVEHHSGTGISPARAIASEPVPTACESVPSVPSVPVLSEDPF